MSWDFETDPAYQKQLDWAADFVRNDVEPLDYVIEHPADMEDPLRNELIPPLQEEVRRRGLWATHLGPELGGPGHGQVKLALLNEILGRSQCAPIVFGCQAPDSGNSEILAHFGSKKLKDNYLKPLLENQIVSAFSMTEPQGGADPNVFRTSATLDGDEWVINGQKWFSTHARFSSFLIVMAITDPENPPRHQMSMFIVPTKTDGVRFIRNVGMGYEDGPGVEGYIEYDNVRVPTDHMLGERSAAFAIAQTRLGGGRIHHAMRTVGLVERTFDMLCERAVSRTTQGGRLADKQLVQGIIADSWIQLETFRLLTMRTAWKIDRFQNYKIVRGDISAVKAYMQQVLHDVAQRTIQIHGSLGVTNEMPLVRTLVDSFVMGLADGPTEIHKLALARHLLREVQPAPDLFPSAHVPRNREKAERKYKEILARHSEVGVGPTRSG